MQAIEYVHTDFCNVFNRQYPSIYKTKNSLHGCL